MLPAVLAVMLLSVPARADDDLLRASEALRRVFAEGKAKSPSPDARGARTGPYVRLPTWELGSVVSQLALTSGESKLTEKERALALEVFGPGTIDLDAVRVVAGPSPTDTPMVWGNTIRVPGGHDVSSGTMAHELTHVWQYQTSGSSYISDSFLKQACSFIAKGDRGAAYQYVIVDDKTFVNYGAEQQADIVETWVAYPKRRADERYNALLAQMRARKAGKYGAVMMEKDAGLPPRGKDLPEVPRGGPSSFNNEAAKVPQFELRF